MGARAIAARQAGADIVKDSRRGQYPGRGGKTAHAAAWRRPAHERNGHGPARQSLPPPVGLRRLRAELRLPRASRRSPASGPPSYSKSGCAKRWAKSNARGTQFAKMQKLPGGTTASGALEKAAPYRQRCRKRPLQAGVSQETAEAREFHTKSRSHERKAGDTAPADRAELRLRLRPFVSSCFRVRPSRRERRSIHCSRSPAKSNIPKGGRKSGGGNTALRRRE